MRAEVIRVFTAWHRGELVVSQPAIPDFTNPVLATRAWADQLEGRQLADPELNTVWSAGEEQFKLQTKMATKQALALEPNFQNWAKDKALTTPWEKAQAREEFNIEVTRARRNLDPTQTYDPHVTKAAQGMRDWYGSYLALATDPGAAVGLFEQQYLHGDRHPRLSRPCRCKSTPTRH